MNVWIVNPFDNLPSEGNRPQRYWLMAEAFERLAVILCDPARVFRSLRLRLLPVPCSAPNVVEGG